MEIKLNDRMANVELVSRQGRFATLIVDGKTYTIDMVETEKGIYSLLLNGLSYNVEVVEGQEAKKFKVNTYLYSYDIQIIDAEAKYRNRNTASVFANEKNIIAPMPGKVVKILVQDGQAVEPGQTLLIISAMKMDSEYKAKASGTVRHILVKEGDKVDGKQVLILID
ncbi:MAG: Acetyl-CoA carboxylase, biotin carboxyl carrier protein [Bacteroidetes bacterium 38_7]|nr:MAG: Acetyl-CoA carboxylase, biotin carboxyl carrier protein [Bacteroidetes bacterium 38_7]HAL64729.1 acetyl-CoA carboxylase biotin carboxyl carrier protein subunit [Bacteroidales bacterium]